MSLVREMQDVLDRYVALYGAQDAAGIAAMYAVEGRVYSPFGPPAIGRDAIAGQHRSWFAYGEKNKRIQVIEAHVGGDLAYCLASFAAEVEGESGQPETMSGTTVAVLRRGDGGAWKFLVTSLTTDQPEP